MAGLMARFTMANSAGLYPPMRGTASPRKRRAKATTTKRKRARSTARKARSGRPARLVKGSAAAKRYMAKIRRMRRK